MLTIATLSREKFVRPTFAILALCTLSVQAQQNAVSSIFLSKDRFFRQSSANRVALLPAADLPFGFTAEVECVSSRAAANLKPSITLPAASGFAAMYQAKPALGLEAPGDSSWNFGFTGGAVRSNFDDWGTRTKSELDRAFPNGTYVFRAQGKTISLRLPKDSYPPAPVIRLTGGSWSGGSYYIDPKKPLVIHSGVYANYGSNLNNYIFLEMEDAATGNELFDHTQVAKAFPNGPTRSSAKFYSRTIPANTLRAGRKYYVCSGFGVMVSQSAAIPRTPSLATFGSETEVEVIARRAP